jgi:hypothetical protein
MMINMLETLELSWFSPSWGMHRSRQSWTKLPKVYKKHIVLSLQTALEAADSVLIIIHVWYRFL